MKMEISRDSAVEAETKFGDPRAGRKIQEIFKLYSLSYISVGHWLLTFDNEQAFNEFAGLLLILSVPVPKWHSTMNRVTVTMSQADMNTLYDMVIRKS